VGVGLPETRGLHPIHVTEAAPGVLAGERIKQGDVISMRKNHSLNDVSIPTAWVA
jgi:hypothetical protein